MDLVCGFTDNSMGFLFHVHGKKFLTKEKKILSVVKQIDGNDDSEKQAYSTPR